MIGQRVINQNVYLQLSPYATGVVHANVGQKGVVHAWVVHKVTFLTPP
jgi:hypothetical protein